jgi:hypothetical protein
MIEHEKKTFDTIKAQKIYKKLNISARNALIKVLTEIIKYVII